MGTSTRRILKDSGLPGLVVVVAGCVAVTLLSANTIDSDEAVQVVSVTCLGAIVAAYRVREAVRKENRG